MGSGVPAWPSADLLNRPLRVLGNQWLRVGGCLCQGWEILVRSRVAESYTDVSQESPAFDPLDGGTFEQQVKAGVVER